jgi:hypothetical protein
MLGIFQGSFLFVGVAFLSSALQACVDYVSSSKAYAHGMGWYEVGVAGFA